RRGPGEDDEGADRPLRDQGTTSDTDKAGQDSGGPAGEQARAARFSGPGTQVLLEATFVNAARSRGEAGRSARVLSCACAAAVLLAAAPARADLLPAPAHLGDLSFGLGPALVLQGADARPGATG